MPLPSHESTLAVAVATKTDDTNTKINIYQLVVEDMMGLTVLTKPHLIFNIPVDCPLHEVSLATVLDDDVYAFAYQFWRSGEPVVTEVRPNDSTLAQIGKIRYFLQLGQFDQADRILATLDEEHLTDSLTDFHPSEVASTRLLNLVSNDVPEKDNIEQCLQRLAKGAMTLNTTAVQKFAQACEMIPNQVIHQEASRQIPVLQQVLDFVEKVIDTVPALDSSAVKDVETRLQDRRRALRFVAAVPDKHLSLALVGIKSTGDLLAKLLTQKQYMLVDKLWEWEGGTALDSEMVLTEIVKIPSTVAPTNYLHIIKQLLLPNLTIHHELLPILRAWACDTADEMDENDVGLAEAVSLLEVSNRTA